METEKRILAVLRILQERRQTLALAESCTGGLLSAQLAGVSGISSIYLGGVVAYSNKVKEDWLGVPRHLILSNGAVSLAVATAMAKGARERFASTWALSVTGIAGPGGGSIQKPVGTVCFGIAGPAFEEAVQMHFAGQRREIQAASADQALRQLEKQIGL